ncbi:MAG: methyltransferase domain-containing protein [bacterium]
MDPEARSIRRLTFNADPERYDRARPEYPAAIFDDIALLAALQRGATVLEVGCGTGKATRALAERGYRVVGLDIGADMAAVARRNLAGFPEVMIEVGEFERWDAGGRQFDAIASFSAWHWIDPAVGYERAAEFLVPRGRIVLVGGGHAYPEGFDPFFSEIQATYTAIGEAAEVWPPPSPEEVPDKFADLATSPYFTDFQTKRYLWTIDYTTEQYIDVLNTYSGHSTIAPEKRAILYNAIRSLMAQREADRITKHFQTILHIATRR